MANWRDEARTLVVASPLEEVENVQTGCASKLPAGEQVSAGNYRLSWLFRHVVKLRHPEKGS